MLPIISHFGIVHHYPGQKGIAHPQAFRFAKLVVMLSVSMSGGTLFFFCVWCRPRTIPKRECSRCWRKLQKTIAVVWSKNQVSLDMWNINIVTYVWSVGNIKIWLGCVVIVWHCLFSLQHGMLSKKKPRPELVVGSKMQMPKRQLQTNSANFVNLISWTLKVGHSRHVNLKRRKVHRKWHWHSWNSLKRRISFALILKVCLHHVWFTNYSHDISRPTQDQKYGE